MIKVDMIELVILADHKRALRFGVRPDRIEAIIALSGGRTEVYMIGDDSIIVANCFGEVWAKIHSKDPHVEAVRRDWAASMIKAINQHERGERDDESSTEA